MLCPTPLRLFNSFSELGVLGFGLPIDRKIGIGIFPKGKEFFVGFASGCVVAHQPLYPTELTDLRLGLQHLLHQKKRHLP